MKPLFLFLAFIPWALAAVPVAGAAEALMEAISSQVESNQASAKTQETIDALSEETRGMLDEYREALRRTEVLTAYNAHVRRLIESQEAEKHSLASQLGEVEATRREIVPLMLRMEETLERFVPLDRPFLSEERGRRVSELKALMVRADVSEAEKFRRLLEAYQIENEYGKTIEAYRAELPNGHLGTGRTVDFLRIGRVALFYQSLDGHDTGWWSNSKRQWQTLPPAFNKAVRKGLAIARKESAPELLPIAVDAPETVR